MELICIDTSACDSLSRRCSVVQHSLGLILPVLIKVYYRLWRQHSAAYQSLLRQRHDGFAALLVVITSQAEPLWRMSRCVNREAS